MKRSRLFVLALTVILIGAALWLFSFNKQEELAIPFKVSVPTPDGEEVINCWIDDQNDYFVFLPTHSNLEDIQICSAISRDIYINGVEIKEGTYCDAFQLNTPYQIVFRDWPNTITREIMFVRSDNVETMFIDTKSGDTELLHSSKEYKEEGTIRTYQCDGSLDYSGQLTSISGRGNATWTDYDKKPYSIEVAEDASLLNMGSARKWILLANAADPSNMRNKIALDLAQSVGLQYSSESRWVDLYLNGEYVGLYLLCEKNEVHSERVAISEDGSFLISVEQETRLVSQNISHIVTDAKQALRIHHPSNVTEVEEQALLSYWQSIENALLSDDGIDVATGKSWLELIDLDSWVKKYLLEELLGNWDASYISQYFYCEGYQDGGKVYAGPAWDYDRTLGNTSWQFQYPNSLYAQRLNVKGSYETPWFHELYQKPEFYDRMVCIYQEVFIPVLNDLLGGTLTEYAEYIDAAHHMDQLRWGINNEISDEQEYINQYLTERIAFLSDLWINNETYHLVQANPGFNQFYAYIAVKDGECLDDLWELTSSDTSKFLGWYHTDTNEPFDSEQPIDCDISLYAQWHGIPATWTQQLMELLPGMVLAIMFCLLVAVSIWRKRSR